MNAGWREKKRWLWVVLYIVPWTVLALLGSTASYLAGGAHDMPPPLAPVMRQEFKCWYACALVSLGVIWFCRKNRLAPGRVARWVAIHFAAAVAFSAVYAVVASWWISGEKSVMHPGQILTFQYLIRTVGLEYSVMNLMIYWLVVFGELGWHYYQRYREREVEAAQLQRELVVARLEALRMQLNPHFLFNTLHAISAMIHENPEAADRMVARLSELLRLSLDSSRAQEVPLQDELAFLNRYLEIEQTRYSDRLQVEQRIEPQVRAALVPYLILQPLVENAIRYAIEPREDAGIIRIQALRSNGKIQLSVTDCGAGFAHGNSGSIQEGIGLSNTRSRLRHLYGEDGQLKLTDAPGGGLEALIEIPYHTEANKALTGTNGKNDD